MCSLQKNMIQSQTTTCLLSLRAEQWLSNLLHPKTEVLFPFLSSSSPHILRVLGILVASSQLCMPVTVPSTMHYHDETHVAFGSYAIWCLVFWVLIQLFVPVIKQFALGELGQAFSVPTWKTASYQIKNSIWQLRILVLRQRVETLRPFYCQAEKLAEALT